MHSFDAAPTTDAAIENAMPVVHCDEAASPGDIASNVQAISGRQGGLCVRFSPPTYAMYEVRDSNFGDPVFWVLDFPTRRFARTLKNTRQSKQIKTHPSTTDLQAITTNRLGNFCRLALQEASILMDTPKGHIFSPSRPPKRAEATAFSPSRHEKETSNETPEHPRYRENKDNDDEEDNQGVPPASSDLTSPRVLKYRREYNEEDGFAAEQAQAS